MRKFVLATLAALTIGSAAFVPPAEARCWWNGYVWHCWHPHGWWWHNHHPWHAGDYDRHWHEGWHD